jgi:metal-responsive CopG/Arc/MetJ family transcriptional regulator
MDQEKKIAKKRGRPATGSAPTIGVRIHPPMLAKLDAFIAATDPAMTRPEAIRHLLTMALENKRDA